MFGLTGAFCTLLIWVAGSHQYGAFSRVWQYVGIPGLLSFAIVAYFISAVILQAVKRSRAPGFGLLFVFWLAAVIPFAYLLYVLIMRFFYGSD